MVLAAQAAPAPEVEAAKDQALINALSAAVARTLRNAATVLRVQASLQTPTSSPAVALASPPTGASGHPSHRQWAGSQTGS